MQGIYTHIPQINYVPREYNVAAILLFLFMVLISLVPVLNLLYFYSSTFRIIIIIIIIYDPASLPPRGETIPVPIEQEAGGVSEPVWTLEKRNIFSCALEFKSLIFQPILLPPYRLR